MQVEFVQTNFNSEQKWRRKPSADVLKLAHYDVFIEVDGRRVCIGGVKRELATFEQRTPGRVYVNKRWESPRWYPYVLGHTGRRPFYCETRKEAAERLLRAWEEKTS
jgi:hypothetical protein